MMKRKFLITLSLLATLVVMAFTTVEKSKTPNTASKAVVLELFTSQGCSSCPSADKLLKNVAADFPNDNIITLSYHVDYWNYIGWKDPFSQKAFTQKQRMYARKFRDNQIYTPAVVINGKEHFVGSDKRKMYAKINSYKNEVSAHRIVLTQAEKKKEKVAFAYAVPGDISNMKARIVLAIKERKTHVKRGENGGRTLINANIVVYEKYVEDFQNDGKVAIEIPEIVTENDELHVYFILENQQNDILNAQQIHIK